MDYRNFIGGSYELESVKADVQRTINLVPELIESGSGKAPARMFKRGGLAVFADFAANTPVAAHRGILHVVGQTGEHVFVLAPHAGGNYALWELASNGTFWQLTAGFANEARSMASNGDQVVIACSDSVGSTLYCLEVATGALNLITTLDPHHISQVVWHPDGYFIGLDCIDRKIYISSLMDGTEWDPTDTAQVFVTDVPRCIKVDHKEVWIYGEKGTAIYYDNPQGPSFPFEPIPGVSLQTGILGTAVDQLDNTLVWVAQTERGGWTVQRAEGHASRRISNAYIEERIAAANPTVDTITVRSLDYRGHPLFILSITGAETSLVWDAGTGLWHEWASNGGLFLGKHHCFAWGKHLFTSRDSNVIYALDDDAHTDDGAAVAWLRRAPHLSGEGELIFYHGFRLDCEVGNPGTANPQVWMRFSDDGGYNWTTAAAFSMGPPNQRRQRVEFGPTGAGDDRVFEISGTDPVSVTIVGAYLQATRGR